MEFAHLIHDYIQPNHYYHQHRPPCTYLLNSTVITTSTTDLNMISFSQRSLPQAPPILHSANDYYHHLVHDYIQPRSTTTSTAHLVHDCIQPNDCYHQHAHLVHDYILPPEPPTLYVNTFNQRLLPPALPTLHT